MTDADPAAVTIPGGTVGIPGTGWQYVLDSQYPTEEPERMARLTGGGRQRNYGRNGWAFVLGDARADDLADLYEYVESAAGAQEEALGDQRGDPESYASVRRDAEGLRKGADRLAVALRLHGVEPLTYLQRVAAERAAG